MTPTLPDNWFPPQYTPTAEKDRDDVKTIAPTPVKIVRVAKFYFKETK